jgi:hypothetical protein
MDSVREFFVGQKTREVVRQMKTRLHKAENGGDGERVRAQATAISVTSAVTESCRIEKASQSLYNEVREPEGFLASIRKKIVVVAIIFVG